MWPRVVKKEKKNLWGFGQPLNSPLKSFISDDLHTFSCLRCHELQKTLSKCKTKIHKLPVNLSQSLPATLFTYLPTKQVLSGSNTTYASDIFRIRMKCFFMSIFKLRIENLCDMGTWASEHSRLHKSFSLSLSLCVYHTADSSPICFDDTDFSFFLKLYTASVSEAACAHSYG